MQVLKWCYGLSTTSKLPTLTAKSKTSVLPLCTAKLTNSVLSKQSVRNSLMTTPSAALVNASPEIVNKDPYYEMMTYF